MLRKVGRAFYSTDITQEFLQGILARAQEATAKKATSSSRPSRRQSDNFKKVSQRRSPKITSRVRSSSSSNVVAKQPQFEKRSGPVVKGASEEVELMDALSEPKPSSRKGPNLKKSKKEFPRRPKNPTVKVDAKPFVISQTAPRDYRPQEPTPLSLMKFHPNLPNTGISRFISFSLDAMRSGDFPLNRFPNQGFYDKPHSPPKHVALSLLTPTFGKYMPDTGLVFERESFLSELAISCDPSRLDSIVLGKYQTLKPRTSNSFSPLAKSDKKMDELATNAEVVRKSLDGNPLDAITKEVLYDVCCGLKPISDLTQ